MDRTLSTGELDIVVVANNHNPSILNPDFLVRNHIVEEAWKWQFEQDPVTTPHLSQVVYQSGVLISAEFNRLVFRERNGANIPGGTLVPQIASKYVRTLPHVTYTAIGVNIKGHVFAQTEEESVNFVTSGLLKDGPWRRFASGVVGGSVAMVFRVNNAQMSLSISTALLRLKDGPPQPCVMFQANFHREIKDATHDDAIAQTLAAIEGWQRDYTAYTELVQGHLLRG